MALQIQLIEPNNEPMVELQEKLWLTANGRVVKDGDPRAASLLGTPGKRVPKSLYDRLVLADDEETEEESVEVPPYEEWTVEELRSELDDRKLPTSGVKAELVARLETDDLAEENSDEDNSEGDED